MIKRSKKLLTVMVLLLPIFCCAQQKGIRFEQDLSWQKIKEKAKAENKYVFVDCYATWCVPCKQMDANVYPNDSVGNQINPNFIAVKIQMDTSKKDDERITNWYADAQLINAQYNVSAYPTFLFFSPDGGLVHKEMGYKDVQSFIAVANDALNPKKQYVSLLKSYEQGKKDYSAMKYLALTASTNNDTALARKIAMDYIDNYLLRLKKEELYTKENIEFIRGFSTRSTDAGFLMMYKNAEKINEVMNDRDYVQLYVYTIVYLEQLSPAIQTASKNNSYPQWDELKKSLATKYNDYYAQRTVIDAKARWYEWKKEGVAQTKNTIEYLQKFGSTLSNYDINDRAWKIFPYVVETGDLNVAIQCMEKVVNTEKDSTNALPAYLDTYANLLHKAGRTQEAIPIEEKAFNMANENNMAWYTIADLFRNLKKMKKGKPTWIPEED
jgi:thioredoxin-related protein